MDLRRSVNTRIWADEWFEGLSRDEKLLWLYLLTNQYTNMLGIYEVSMSRISFETGITRETLSKAFERFQREGKAFYICNRFVFLVNWLKNQSMNTNMEKNARTSLENLPDDVLSALSTMHMESFESLSKGLVMLPEIEREKEIENGNRKLKVKAESGYPPDFDLAWELYKRKGSKKLALAEWNNLTDDEKKKVHDHIPAYIGNTEPKYVKDFERYLKHGKYESETVQAHTKSEYMTYDQVLVAMHKEGLAMNRFMCLNGADGKAKVMGDNGDPMWRRK
jgi:hypothetical protein